jgi:hypothetical protein
MFLMRLFTVPITVYLLDIGVTSVTLQNVVYVSTLWIAERVLTILAL